MLLTVQAIAGARFVRIAQEIGGHRRARRPRMLVMAGKGRMPCVAKLVDCVLVGVLVKVACPTLAGVGCVLASFRCHSQSRAARDDVGMYAHGPESPGGGVRGGRQDVTMACDDCRDCWRCVCASHSRWRRRIETDRYHDAECGRVWRVDETC